MTNPVNPEFLDRRLDARGVPKGGTEGQTLTKATDVDNDVVWSTPTVADGSITASKLAANAVTTPAVANDAVTPAKIAQGTAGQVLMTDGTPDTAWVTLSGDVTVSATGLTAISAGVIVDGDISATAAITHSKLANITAGRVLLGNASNVPTATALSGDVTVNSSGATTIANDAVTPAKIAQGTAGQVLMTNATPDTAWVTLSGDVTVNSSGVTTIANDAVGVAKIAQGTAGQVLMTNATPDTAWTTLSGDVTVNSSGVTAIGSGVIVDGDISATAAITHSKLANITAGSVLLGNASNVPTATALSGDVTVNSSGVTAIGAGVIVKADLSTAAGQIAGTWDQALITTRGNISGVQTATLYSMTIGKTFHFQISMATGNTATAAGAITFTLPGTPSAARTQVLNGRTSNNVGLCTISTNVVTMTANATGGNFTAGQALGTVNIGGTIEIN